MQTDLAFKTGWDFDVIQSWHYDRLMHFWAYMELKNEEAENAQKNNGGNGGVPMGTPLPANARGVGRIAGL